MWKYNKIDIEKVLEFISGILRLLSIIWNINTCFMAEKQFRMNDRSSSVVPLTLLYHVTFVLPHHPTAAPHSSHARGSITPTND